jgi:hypothetical protein
MFDPLAKRTTNLEGCVFGRTEVGIRGLDQRVATNETSITDLRASLNVWNEDRRWLKRAVYSALIVAAVSLAVGLVQFALLG